MNQNLINTISSAGINSNSYVNCFKEGNILNIGNNEVFNNEEHFNIFSCSLENCLPGHKFVPLGARKVSKKNQLVGVMDVSSEAFKVKKVLREVLGKVAQNSFDSFLDFEKELKILFRNVFISQSESQESLSQIRGFLGDFCSAHLPVNNAQDIRNSLVSVLDNGGAMALYGTFNSICSEVRSKINQ